MVAAAIHLKHLIERCQQVQYAVKLWPEVVAREMMLAVRSDWRQAQDPYGNAQPPAAGDSRTNKALGILRRAVRSWERSHLGQRAGEGTDLSHQLRGGRSFRRHARPLIEGGFVGGGLGKHDGGGNLLTAQGAAAARSRAKVAETHRFDPEGHLRDAWQPFVDGNVAGIASDHEAAAALQRKYKGRPRRLMHPIQGDDPGTWGRRYARVLKRLLFGESLGAQKRFLIKTKAAQRRAEKLAAKNAARNAKHAAKFAAKNGARVAAGKKPLKAPRPLKQLVARKDKITVRALRG